MLSTTGLKTPRTALVLGGTSGLGRASAQALISQGSDVVITGRAIERTRAVADDIGACAMAVDLTEPAALASFVHEVAEWGIDQLVLNSGGPAPGMTTAIDSDDVRSAMGALLYAHMDLVSATLPAMRERGWGRIVAIGSSGVQQPIPHLALSNIGRSALAAYLKGIAVDVARDGVTVNMVLPGRIDTQRVAALDAATAERQGVAVQAVRSASEAAIPSGRYGSPEEFAAAVAFLCGDTASYVTGEQLRVDGGMLGLY